MGSRGCGDIAKGKVPNRRLEPYARAFSPQGLSQSPDKPARMTGMLQKAFSSQERPQSAPDKKGLVALRQAVRAAAPTTQSTGGKLQTIPLQLPRVQLTERLPLYDHVNLPPPRRSSRSPSPSKKIETQTIPDVSPKPQAAPDASSWQRRRIPFLDRTILQEYSENTNKHGYSTQSQRESVEDETNDREVDFRSTYGSSTESFKKISSNLPETQYQLLLSQYLGGSEVQEPKQYTPKFKSSPSRSEDQRYTAQYESVEHTEFEHLEEPLLFGNTGFMETFQRYAPRFENTKMTEKLYQQLSSQYDTADFQPSFRDTEQGGDQARETADFNWGTSDLDNTGLKMGTTYRVHHGPDCVCSLCAAVDDSGSVICVESEACQARHDVDCRCAACRLENVNALQSTQMSGLTETNFYETEQEESMAFDDSPTDKSTDEADEHEDEDTSYQVTQQPINLQAREDNETASADVVYEFGTDPTVGAVRGDLSNILNKETKMTVYDPRAVSGTVAPRDKSFTHRRKLFFTSVLRDLDEIDKRETSKFYWLIDNFHRSRRDKTQKTIEMF